MKERKRSIGCWLGAALMLLLGMTVALSGCVRHDYDFSSTVIHTDPLTTRPKADFSMLAGIYKSDFTMTEPVRDSLTDQTTSTRLHMYLMITEDGSFAFSNKLEFDNAAYGAGSLGMYLDEEPVFIYFALNNKSVTTGSRVSRYEVGKNGEITFLSTMWYGTASPSTEGDEGTVFPTFVPYTVPEAKDLTMGPEAVEVISSARAETTTRVRATTAATTTAESSTTGTTAGTTASTAAKYTTNGYIKYTYKYNPGSGATRTAYTYTMPDGSGKKKNDKTTRAATTAAPHTTEEDEDDELLTTAPVTSEDEEDTTAAPEED
ncbi:MAG: hypothetical protein IK080_06915 [Clostridia bacterium]|nr:hypothetical protein [Clostridia bacterium]